MPDNDESYMSAEPDSGLYLVLLSIHGLIRGKDLELGRDPDTGGQVKYVVELARALGSHPDVWRVDLLTRQIMDSRVDDSYAQPLEKISNNVYIRRITCGPRRYLRKESLWPYLDVFVDQSLLHFRQVGRLPSVIHGHYADAGYTGAQLARLLSVPFIFTGHSLGRVKLQRLLDSGMDRETVEKKYSIGRRIEAEEYALDTSALVVTSTKQEVKEQYEIYDQYAPERTEVIPPGINLTTFFPPGSDKNQETGIQKKIDKFLHDPEKPMVFTISRPDEKKNFRTLIEAFGENDYLRKNSNLVIVAGERDDIQKFDAGRRKVLTRILLLIDKYDLYGHAAFPKHHDPEEVPQIYRLTAQRKGVFVNAALTEPFGLTLLEAAASGVPVVATNDGGPNDIIGTCKNGSLIDPLNSKQIGDAIEEILKDRDKWREYSQNGIKGVKKHFSWKAHSNRYINRVNKLMDKQYYGQDIFIPQKSRLTRVDRLIITDVDNTLLGDDEALDRMKKLLKESDNNLGFGIATGRYLKSAVEVLKEHDFPTPDIFVTSVGTEINYGSKLVPDRTWKNHLDYFWQPDEIRSLMSEVPGLSLQEDSRCQREYKISYDVDETALSYREIVRIFRRNKIKVRVIYSHKAFLDILPIRASKGLAVRYLSIKWGIPIGKILVAGDSGNDEEMLKGNTLGVVVGNYSDELDKLDGDPRVYFAEASYADGIIEGVRHYNLLGKVAVPEEDAERKKENKRN
ncbi:MAG: HAD-IIB family hydrolase [Verrucomicrobiota bacterium]